MFIQRPSLVLALALTGSTEVGAEEAYRVRGVWGLPAATRLAMAASAEPSWHTVPARGANLKALLREKCGEQGAVVETALESMTLRLNGGRMIDRSVAGGVAVALPFCLKLEQEVPVTVERGDTVDSLLREHYGLAGPRTKQQMYELNNTKGQWASVEHFSRSMEPGQTVVLPYQAEPRRYEQATRGLLAMDAMEMSSVADTSLDLPELVRQTAPASAADALLANAEPVAPNPPAPRAPHDYDYVEFIPVAAALGDGGCRAGAPPAPPFPVDVLRQRLDIEAAAAEEFVGPRRSALVGVVDSGISGPDTGVFRSALLHANRWELKGRDDKDDDRPKNGYIDDVYGINFNEADQSGSILFYAHDSEREHGTRVGSLVLGGKDWVDGMDVAKLPWVRVKVVNFSHSTEDHPVDARALAQAIYYLIGLDARVVNLSLANEQVVEGVNQAIGTTQRTLFVVAAGNTQSGGLNLATEDVYPAKSGGRLSSVILTVGAHNDTDARGLARFSNYSPEYVDLLAPGCSVPTLDVNANVVLEQGTSIATAVASFAAGLLGALGETDARNIKNRLVASVDVDPGLASQSWSSGRLNIVKAISLSHDVVESNDLAKPYDFVHLTDRDELRKFCDHEPTQGKLDDIRKVRPNLPDGAKTRIEYWIEQGGRLEKVSCPQKAADQSIGTITVAGQQKAGPPLSQVRDIVLADRPQ